MSSPAPRLEDLAEALLREAWGVSARAKRYLPGPHPASFSSSALDTLDPRKWIVSPKCDGERRALVFAAEGTRPFCVAFDRCLRASFPPLSLPPRMHTAGTVVDAELCGDTYVLLDVVRLEGVSMLRTAARDRVTCCAQLADMIQGGDVRAKMWVWCNHLADYVTRDWWWGLGREGEIPNDGLVMVRASAPLTSGDQRDMLKWKRTHTIDCWEVRAGGDGRGERLWINDSGRAIPLSSVLAYTLDGRRTPLLPAVSPPLPSPPLTDVFEFAVHKDGVLERLRPRPDKDAANNITTVQRTIRDAAENCSLERLCMWGCGAAVRQKRRREEGSDQPSAPGHTVVSPPLPTRHVAPSSAPPSSKGGGDRKDMKIPHTSRPMA